MRTLKKTKKTDQSFSTPAANKTHGKWKRLKFQSISVFLKLSLSKPNAWL